LQDTVAEAIKNSLSKFVFDNCDKFGITGALSCCLGISEALCGALSGVALGVGMSRDETRAIYARLMSASGEVANEISNHALMEKLGLTPEQLQSVIEKARESGHETDHWTACDFEELKKEADKIKGDDDTDGETSYSSGTHYSDFFRELADELKGLSEEDIDEWLKKKNRGDDE